MNFVILCKAVRLTTNTVVMVEIPRDCDDPQKATDYIGNLFDWQFIPARFDLVTPEEAQEVLRV